MLLDCWIILGCISGRDRCVLVHSATLFHLRLPLHLHDALIADLPATRFPDYFCLLGLRVSKFFPSIPAKMSEDVWEQPAKHMYG